MKKIKKSGKCSSKEDVSIGIAEDLMNIPNSTCIMVFSRKSQFFDEYRKLMLVKIKDKYAWLDIGSASMTSEYTFDEAIKKGARHKTVYLCETYEEFAKWIEWSGEFNG